MSGIGHVPESAWRASPFYATPLKWPGGKWKLAEWILGQMPTHSSYVEPFCGSAAVFFLKPKALCETLNDLDSRIVTFFRVLRERGEELARAVDATPWSREEYELAFEPTDDPLEAARRLCVSAWQQHGMRQDESNGWRLRVTASNGLPQTQQWNQLPWRLLATKHRLKDAQIEHRPALDVIRQHRSREVLLYCDPPYVLGTRTRTQYRYEMRDAEHVELLDALREHPGPVMLSGYPSALYDEHLGDWHRRQRKALAEHGQVRTEVLWLNEEAVRSGKMQLFMGYGEEECPKG